MIANGDMTFTMGSITVPLGSWEYKVSTMYAACELSLLDSLKPDGGKCLVCGQSTKIGDRSLHPVGSQHTAIVKIPGTFPVDPQGNTKVPIFWDVVIQRGANVLIQMKFQLGQQIPDIPDRQV